MTPPTAFRSTARNRIRNELMPWAEEKLNGQAAATCACGGRDLRPRPMHILRRWRRRHSFRRESRGRAGTCRGDDCFWTVQPEIAEGLSDSCLNRPETARRKEDISAGHVEAVLSLTGPGGGGQTDLPGGLTARRGYRYLEILAESGGAF